MLKTHIHGHIGAGLCALVLAGAGLTACGGSSSSSNTSASSARAMTSTQSAAAPTVKTAPVQRAPQVGAATSPRRRPINPQSLVSPAQRTALLHGFEKFTSCLRQNGVKVAPPNTSGQGPLFNSKGLNTNTPQYRTALPKCRGALIAAFRESAKARLGARVSAAKH